MSERQTDHFLCTLRLTATGLGSMVGAAIIALLAAAVILAAPVSSVAADADACHPPIDPSRPQYVVGYGSLMNTESKRWTEPDAGENLPAMISGFERSWNIPGVYPTTFLGVQPEAGAEMAAAIYRSFPKDGALSADARELDYCRAAVDPAGVTMLDGSATPASGQIWVYVNKPDKNAAPTPDIPIVQSYVDIFIIGCLDLHKRLADPNIDFVEKCVRTTQGWSEHWVNDRIYPRRPFRNQPRAFEIDNALRQLLPNLYPKVRIE